MYQLIDDTYDRIPPPDDDPAYGQCSVRVNWGGMKAGADEGALTDHNLATQSDTYVKLTTHSEEPGITKRLREIEAADKRIVDAWSGTLPELEKAFLNRRLHGYGIFHFPQPNSWHFKSVHPRDIIYPGDATFNLDDWEWFALRADFKVTDLLARLRDEEAAKLLGYQPEHIKALIEKLKKEGATKDQTIQSLDETEDDLFLAHQAGNKVKGYQFFVVEFDGKVSEYHVVDDDDITGFIYKGVKRHESMAKTIRLLPLGLGKGLLRHARGYGLDMMAHHDVEDLTRNRLIENFLNAGAVIQGTGDDDLQRLDAEMKDYGSYKVLPAGLGLSQTQFPDGSKQGLVVLSEIERSANNRNRAMGGADQMQRTGEMSATQSRLLAQQGQGAESNEVARFMVQLSGFHALRFERVWASGPLDPGGDVVEKERKVLERKGITKAVFEQISEVKARRTFGDGNPRNQFLAMSDLAPYYGRWPEAGKKLYDYQLACAALGDHDLAREVTGYGGEIDQTAVENRWRAQMENNTFETSDTAVPLGPNDNHLVHLSEHTIYAEEVVQRVQGQIVSEADGFARLSRTKAHVSPHLSAFSQDEKSVNEFRAFMQRWAVLENEIRKLQQHLAEQQQAQQQKQLEEMRNPRPSVKDQETSMTEEIKRQSLLRETDAKIAIMERESELRTKQMLTEGAAKAATDLSSGFDQFGRKIA